jgi:VWFA-related protein
MHAAAAYASFALRVAIPVLLALLAAVLSGTAPPAHGQEEPPPTLVINQVDTSAYPEVTAVVTALDGRGVPIRGLTADRFQAFDGGARLDIVGVTSAQDNSVAFTAVVVIDTSGSMAGEPLNRAKQAATEFVSNLASNESAAIIAFDGAVTPVVGITTDRDQLVEGIENLQAGGDTALFEAVQTSSYIAGSAPTPRSAVILLSDGQNDAPASAATREGSLAAAQGSGAPVYTIGFGDEPDTAYLEELSAATQAVYSPATTVTISDVYASIAELLRSQYVVSLRAEAPADGMDSTLQLVALVGDTPAAATMAFRRGIAPAGPPPLSAQDTPDEESGGGEPSSRVTWVIGVALALVGALTLVFVGTRLYARRRLRRAQLAIVAPNIRRAAEQPLPRRHGVAVAAGGVAVAAPTATGRLISLPDSAEVHPLGAGPAVIGTSRRHCNIVLPHGADAAPEHARIWLRDGRYLLHHVGGMSRKTYVNNHEADWIVLEDGDELRFGKARFAFAASPAEL